MVMMFFIVVAVAVAGVVAVVVDDIAVAVAVVVVVVGDRFFVGDISLVLSRQPTHPPTGYNHQQQQ
jgi:hypothetical protein